MAAVRTHRMHILATGLNHCTAPIELRERVAFRDARLTEALQALHGRPWVSEAAILSTCNRSELYAATPDPVVAARDITAFLSDYHNVAPAEVQPHLYQHADDAAARHLFRVAVGLDSLVLGENQILSQVKHALQQACDVGTTRSLLNELFQRSLHLGKKARTETGLSRGAVSISSAAVDLARQVFGDLRGRRVLVVGAGKMSQQTLRHLMSSGVETVVVANRTYQRAAELAREYGGTAVTFDELERHLADADIVVSASAAPHAILTVDKLRPYLTRRRGRPLFIIDIALPRDVEPAVAELPNVYLFDIDDLKDVADHYRQERSREVDQVEAMIADETQRFMSWISARDAGPVIRELRQKADALRDAECDRWLRKLGDLDAGQQDLVRQMMRSFENKLLHAPVSQIRALAEDDPTGERVELVRRLFDLDAHAAEVADAQSPAMANGHAPAPATDQAAEPTPRRCPGRLVDVDALDATHSTDPATAAEGGR